MVAFASRVVFVIFWKAPSSAGSVMFMLNMLCLSLLELPAVRILETGMIHTEANANGIYKAARNARIVDLRICSRPSFSLM